MLKQTNVGKRKESFSKKLKDSNSTLVNGTAKRENCQELEELALKGKIDLRIESWQALYHDYQEFKNNPIILPLIVKEILQRTEKASWFIKVREDWHCTIWLNFRKDGWDLWPRYKEAPALANAQHEKHFLYDFEGAQELEDWIEEWKNQNTCERKIATAKLWLIAGRIRFLEQKLRNIRKQVEQQPELRDSLWYSYKDAQDELVSLDPFNKELEIGILGGLFFTSLADQG